jgi:hypothetical protein
MKFNNKLKLNYKIKWNKLKPEQKTVIASLIFLQLSLLIAALVDIYRRPSIEIRGRKIWWVLGSFIDFIGPIAYFVFGRNILKNRKDFI